MWYDTARHGSVRHGSVSARFAFPLQFSTALEWAGFFTCHYSCAASTAWLLKNVLSLSRSITLSLDPLFSYQWRNVCTDSTDKTKCAHSKQLHLILLRPCWFKSSGSVASRAASSMTQAMPIFFVQSVINWDYTSCFGNGTACLEPQPRWY